MSNEEDTYTFVVEWHDAKADLSRKYNLTYWPKDGSLSMYDVAKNRLFLKRVVANKDITFPNDLYVGKTIVVFSRRLNIIAYADLFTKNKFELISKSYNILFVNFKSFTHFLTEINKYKAASFHFKTIKSVTPNQQIQQFLQIEKTNEILIICEFVGSKDIASAFNECKKDNNAHFNGIMYDANKDKVLVEEIKQCPASVMLSTNQLQVSSLCLIKPHAISASASIINDILNEGFNITAITAKKLTLSEAKDFYEIYNGVVKEYKFLVEQLLSGSAIALQIECNSMNKENVNDENENKEEINTNSGFKEFREFVGPSDPTIAKCIRPHTLRAKYGTDRVQNAVHCTDLQEDGNLESQFFFQIIS